MQKQNHNGAKILLTLIILAGICAAAIHFVDFVAVSDTFLGINYEPSTEMAELIGKDEFTKTGERILKASRPELLEAVDFNSKCYSGAEEENSVLGCYTNNTIYVYNIQNKDLDGIKETVLAHELLHAVWHRMGIDERRALYQDIDAIYEANKDELGEHMAGYASEDHYDELHSVIGTQISSDKLTEGLREHYAKYLVDQSRIVSYYDSYNGKFKVLEKHATELEAQIEANRTRIETMTAKYESDAEDLLKNINSFNARAENGDFADSASFYAERNELVARQNQLQNDFESLNSLISETNAMIQEYNNSVIEVGKLYDSVNSRIQEPATQIQD